MIEVINMLEMFIEGFLLWYFYCHVLEPKLKPIWTELIGATLYFLVCSIFLGDVVKLEWFRTLAIYVFQILFIIFAFKGSFKFRAFVFFIGEILVFASEMFSVLIATEILGVNYEQLDLRTLIGIRTVFYAAYIFLIMFAIVLIKRIRNQFTTKHLALFLAFPISQAIIVFICIYLQYGVQGGNLAMYLTFLAGIIAILSNILLYKAIVQIGEKEAISYRLLAIMRQREAEFHRLREVTTLNQENRKMRHDINNNLGAVYALMQSGNSEQATELVGSLVEQIKSLENISFCGNPIIDAVLSVKTSYARTVGIQMDLDIQVNDLLPIDDMDLCSLFSNLLDNAIESCERVTDEKQRYLHLTSTIKQGYLAIKLENAVPVENIPEPKRLLSSKRGRREKGLGMQIIEEIAAKYNGQIKIRQGENEFNTTVLLKMVLD